MTFYAIVVVPVANSILPSGEQGFVTQEVTNWMNRLGVLVLLILVANALYLRSRAFWGVCAILIASYVALFVVHGQIDQLLDPSAFAVADQERFQSLHERYLIVVTTQWFAALAALWLLLCGQATSGETSEGKRDGQQH